MHFLCLVVGDDPEAQLEPFAEWSEPCDQIRFDWYEIGGRFDGYLRLKQPKQPSLIARLLRRLPIVAANQARRSEVDEQAILHHPPAALLFRGEWKECPISFSPSAETREWDAQFPDLFAAVPTEDLLTVVDCHL